MLLSLRAGTSTRSETNTVMQFSTRSARTQRAFLRSGGHPELVGEGGIGFEEPEELPSVLGRLRDELPERRARIHVPPLGDVADRYLDALRG